LSKNTSSSDGASVSTSTLNLTGSSGSKNTFTVDGVTGVPAVVPVIVLPARALGATSKQAADPVSSDTKLGIGFVYMVVILLVRLRVGNDVLLTISIKSVLMILNNSIFTDFFDKFYLTFIDFFGLIYCIKKYPAKIERVRMIS
jgi:hypothetical protein